MDTIRLAKERALKKMYQRKETIINRIENNDVSRPFPVSCIALFHII